MARRRRAPAEALRPPPEPLSSTSAAVSFTAPSAARPRSRGIGNPLPSPSHASGYPMLPRQFGINPLKRSTDPRMSNCSSARACPARPIFAASSGSPSSLLHGLGQRGAIARRNQYARLPIHDHFRNTVHRRSNHRLCRRPWPPPAPCRKFPASEHSTATSLAAMIAAMSFRAPANSRLPEPSPRACARSVPSSGPPPTISSRASGRRPCSRENASISSA